VWEEVPDNVLVDTVFGDRGETERRVRRRGSRLQVEIRHRALHRGHDRAARRARRLRPAAGRYTLYAGTGGAVRQKKDLAAVLGVDESKVRVITRDVGGNFGSKNRVYVEYGLALWARASWAVR